MSPSLEEAAQTLRASRARVFRTVTWPLLRPALANSFLLGFVESLADFGNPVVLAGNYDVLSTKIFFAVAGAQHEPGRAVRREGLLPERRDEPRGERRQRRDRHLREEHERR